MAIYDNNNSDDEMTSSEESRGEMLQAVMNHTEEHTETRTTKWTVDEERGEV